MLVTKNGNMVKETVLDWLRTPAKAFYSDALKKLVD
jgi:hypothetical protein